MLTIRQASTWYSNSGKGQYRNEGQVACVCWLICTAWGQAGSRVFGHQQTPRSWCRYPRQDKSFGVGEFQRFEHQCRLESTWRPDARCLPSEYQVRWKQFWFSRRCSSGSMWGCIGHRSKFHGVTCEKQH